MRYSIERTNAVGLTPEAADKLAILSKLTGAPKQTIVSALVSQSFDSLLLAGIRAEAERARQG